MWLEQQRLHWKLYLRHDEGPRNKNTNCRHCSHASSDCLRRFLQVAAPIGVAAEAAPCGPPSLEARGFGSGKAEVPGADPSDSGDPLEAAEERLLSHEARIAAAACADLLQASPLADNCGCSDDASSLPLAGRPRRARLALSLRARGWVSASVSGAARAFRLAYTQGSGAGCLSLAASALGPHAATPGCASLRAHRAWGGRAHGYGHRGTGIGDRSECAHPVAAPGGQPAPICELTSPPGVPLLRQVTASGALHAAPALRALAGGSVEATNPRGPEEIFGNEDQPASARCPQSHRGQ